MQEDFKFREVFNPKVVIELAESIQKNYDDFQKEAFCDTINTQINDLNFGERSQLITYNLQKFLPQNFPDAVNILLESLPEEIQTEELTGFDRFIIMPQTAFVSKYGLEHYDLSMKVLYEMTKRFTAEGDIRIFIQKFPAKTLAILEEWAEDENCHVRRLVSEGTRPRLPLGMRLKQFQQDPKPVLKLLEKLKEDPVLYVRRSVANNLNDIAKDNPKAVTDTLKVWKQIQNEGTQWLIKHALRTLLKQGNSEALALLGYETLGIELSSITLKKDKIKIGEELVFNFDIESRASEIQNLMIDYIIYYQKANGKQSPKVFKLSKKELAPNQTLSFEKKHSFKPISTRKHYVGIHSISLQINGQEFEKVDFELYRSSI